MKYECECYVKTDSRLNLTGNIEKCPLCKAAPKLLEACQEFAFLEKTNMTKKQVQLRIEIAKAAIAEAEGENGKTG